MAADKLGTARQRAEEALKSVGLSYTVEEGKNFVEFIVDVARLKDAALALKNAGFGTVVSVTATDYPKRNTIKVVYHVTSMIDDEVKGAIIGVGVYLPRIDKPSMPSLTGVWLSAEFMEREVFEFFGVEFEGHPDLKPLLLIPPLAEKRPLRKDFVVREENIYEGVPFSNVG